MAKQTQDTAASEGFLKDVAKAFDALEKAGRKVTVHAIQNAN